MFQPLMLIRQTSFNWLVNDHLSQHIFLQYLNKLLNVAEKNMEWKFIDEETVQI